MPPDSPPTLPPAVQITDLSFRWPGARSACLNRQNFTVDRAKSLFIHGPSGSGKSTLLNLLGGVLLPQTGHIDLLGQAFSRFSTRQRDQFRADHLGFIFQQFNLIPYLSAVDNVLLTCRFSPRRAQQAGRPATEARMLLERLDIPPSAQQRPAHQLSIGQQQRVAAARALIGHPEILIADEPTSALDADRQTAFITLLREVAAAHHSSIIFVSHDLRLADHFDACLSLSPCSA